MNKKSTSESQIIPLSHEDKIFLKNTQKKLAGKIFYERQSVEIIKMLKKITSFPF